MKENFDKNEKESVPAREWFFGEIADEFVKMLPDASCPDDAGRKLFRGLIGRLAKTVFGSEGMCLKDLSGEEKQLLRKIKASSAGFVGDGNGECWEALIFDETLSVPALFFNRQFEEEKTIAEGLARLARVPVREITEKQRAAISGVDGGFVLRDEQKLAAEAVLKNRTSIVRGGPGTGKTTLLVQVLVCLMLENPDIEIKLAAPTVKAAARMKEALLKQTCGGNEAIAEKIRKLEPQTLHKLLGIGRHNLTPEPLECDVLAVDEFSMVSQDLAARIFRAVRGNDKLRLILLGDENQLDSVEAGSVLGELAKAEGVFAKPALLDSRRFRPDNFVGKFSRALNAGDEKTATDLLAGEKENYCRVEKIPDSPKEVLKKLIPEALRVPEGKTNEELLSAAENFKILTPVHEGRFGDKELNLLCEEICGGRPRGNGKAGERFFHGLSVLLTESDEDAGLTKGAAGVVVKNSDNNFVALFRGAEPVPVSVLPAWQAGYAVTVHKSQGSEFRNLAVFVPAETNEALLSKQLLYTAVTRFLEDLDNGCRFSLYYDEESLKKCFNDKTPPPSLLCERIKKVWERQNA